MNMNNGRTFFDKSLCQGIVVNEGNGNIVERNIKGRPNSKIIFFAANPAENPNLRDKQGFSGSGLPFPNPDIAFQNTSNVGAVNAVNRKFVILN